MWLLGLEELLRDLSSRNEEKQYNMVNKYILLVFKVLIH